MVQITDERVLQASGIGAACLAAAFIAAPKQTNDLSCPDVIPRPMFHHGGIMAGSIAALNMVTANADVVTRKKVLKVNGAAWLTCGATHLYHARSGQEKRDVALTMAATSLAMGAVNLVAGFRE